MPQFSVRDARNKLSQLIKDAQDGQEVVIASHGTPVARLVPVAASGGEGLARYFARNPIPADGRSTSELDAAINEMRASWE